MTERARAHVMRRSHRDSLRAALRDPQAVRQAILLTEVLGPPVGLRADSRAE